MNSIEQLGVQCLQKRCDQVTDIFICRSQLYVSKGYDVGYVMEYITSDTSPYLIFVELTTNQSSLINNNALEENEYSVEEYNEMLDYCLFGSKRNKIYIY